MKDPRLGELFNSLPAPFRQDAALADFLVAFERILLAEGLEGEIDRLAEAIDPMRAPSSALRWIAGWMGLAIDADYPTGDQRQYRVFVAQTMARYRQRGTLEGMEALLHQFTGQPSSIWNDSRPHRFIVSLNLGGIRNLNEVERLTRVAHALIEREKPAHTSYELKARFLTFQVAGLETADARTHPGQAAKIARPAQVGGRDSKGNITVGNTMLGQAPLKL